MNLDKFIFRLMNEMGRVREELQETKYQMEAIKSKVI